MLSHEQAQELHRLIGTMHLQVSNKAHTDITEDETERALELAALLVADTMEEGVEPPTPDTSINVYFTGDEDGPDLFGVVYDDEDGALECARENEEHGWRVPVMPLLDRAVRLDGDHDE